MRKLWKHQQYAIEKYKDKKAFGLLFSCGLGKGQPVTCKVLTRNGFIKLGALQIGDKVISPIDSKEYSVTGIYNKGIRHINKISFSNRTFTYCDDEHLWNIQTASQRSGDKEKFYTVDMDKLKSISLTKSTVRGESTDHYHNVYVPVNCPIEFTSTDYTDRAYSLGLFIGDGCCAASHATITLAEEDVKQRYEEEIERLGFLLHYKGRYDYAITMSCRGFGSSYKTWLSNEGVEGHSYEKHIPKKYLFADVETRKKILEGLIDSDGYVTGGGKIDYVSTSRQLIDDITFLVSSLGGVVTEGKSKQGKYKKDGKVVECRTAYRCCFRLPCKLSLSRKHTERLNRKLQRTQYKCIEKIEDAGNAECVCIYVDSPDHLYITDDWIVTHNTVTATRLAEEKEHPVLIIAPNVLCEQWRSELENRNEDTRITTKDWQVVVCTSKTKKTKKFKEALDALLDK